jgi:hypothetical protein
LDQGLQLLDLTVEFLHLRIKGTHATVRLPGPD